MANGIKDLIVLFQIILGLALTVTILIQAKGTGLGSAWGGGGETYHSKRGVEKLLFSSSIVLAFLFILISVINVLVA